LRGAPYSGKWGPFQLRFPAWPNVLAMQLVYNLFFLSKFVLGYTKKCLQSTWIQQTLPDNSQLTKANANNEAAHNAFRSGWL